MSSRTLVVDGSQGPQPPGKIINKERRGSQIICVLSNVDQEWPDAAFDLPAPSQNVFSHSGTLEWIIDPPPGEDPDTPTFQDILLLDDRVILPTDDRFYEVDCATGSYRRVVDRNCLPLPETVVEFDRPIDWVTYRDGVYVLELERSPERTDTRHVGVDESGEIRWSRRRGALTLLSWERGRRDTILVEGNQGGREGRPRLGLDPRTGALVEAVTGPPQYVHDWVDWESIDRPVVNVYHDEILSVWNSDGTDLWERDVRDGYLVPTDYDTPRVRDALAWPGTTLLQQRFYGDELEIHLVAVADDATEQWRRVFPSSLQSISSNDLAQPLEVGEDGPHLVLNFEEGTVELALDLQTGHITRQVRGPELPVIEAVIDEGLPEFDPS